MANIIVKGKYTSLSVKDLLDAREMFHVHFLKKRNVVATAIGRYRIRKDAPEFGTEEYRKFAKKVKNEPKTLLNTEVRDLSWPCILVFVKKWLSIDDLVGKDKDDIVPSAIYMPDGREVPVCVIEAVKSSQTDDSVDINRLLFPRNVISGGFPLIVDSQGEEHVASMGCLVSDGNKIYALTNKHVIGEPGSPIFTRVKGRMKKIGVSAKKQLDKVKFSDVYCGFGGEEQVINSDIGLIEIDDINHWKTEVYGIGLIGELKDVNTHNLTLDLINVKKQDNALVRAFGSVSGRIDGEIAALFYRYKSVGGFEYNADFLIGPRDNKPLNIHHGDSGTLWLLEEYEGEGVNKKLKELRPIALHWGAHEFIDGNNKEKHGYGLATCLSNVCRMLNVDIVRGWNLDLDYTWGKTGHFKIAALACELIADKNLSKLLMANQENIGYTDQNLINANVVKGGSGEFVPLADVADLVWRTTKKIDSSNHFADMDDCHQGVFGGKTLLEICKDEKNIDPKVWNKFYDEMDKYKEYKNDTERKKAKYKRGALPFRVWQIYNSMVKYLKAGKVDEFICAGGTLTHYVADACIALHISFLHHGREESEKNVHSDYENGMLDRNMKEVFDAVNKKAKKISGNDTIKGGHAAAKLTVDLMRRTITKMPPLEIIEVWSSAEGRDKFRKMWQELGGRTVECITDGVQVMANIWESAWNEGNGDKIAESKLNKCDSDTLESLYKDKNFLPAYWLVDLELKKKLEG
jgi:hypothetical protein